MVEVGTATGETVVFLVVVATGEDLIGSFCLLILTTLGAEVGLDLIVGAVIGLGVLMGLGVLTGLGELKELELGRLKELELGRLKELDLELLKELERLLVYAPITRVWAGIPTIATGWIVGGVI